MTTAPGPYTRKPRSREFFGLVHQFAPLAASTLGGVDDVSIDGQADYLIHRRVAIFTDGQAKIRFERVPGNLDGSAPYYVESLDRPDLPPVWFPSPLLINRGCVYRAIADDRQTVAADNTLRVLHVGQKCYDHPFEPGKTYTGCEPFHLVADFTAQGIGALAANGSLQYANNIDSAYDFDIYDVVIVADGAASVEIETSGKALKWFNRPCHIALLGASAFNAALRRPFELPSPVLLPAAGAILTTINDLSGAANRVQVIYRGVKLTPPHGLATVQRF